MMDNAADNSSLHTFTARSVRDAYAQVRARLGRDAVIVEQSSSDGVVTVVASQDLPQPQDTAKAGGRVYLERLAEQGFEPSLLRHLGEHAQSWDEARRLVLQLIAMETPPRRLKGAYRFLGVPGAGKTTAIVKLAAEHVLNFGAGGCAVVSTDQRRLAGAEQLNLAAELLGLKFVETTPAGLDAALEDLADRELVLVDSAGISSGTPPVSAAACPDLLVLPAPWQASALRRSLRLLPRGRLAGIVLSQVDQSDCLGPALSLVHELGVPLRWISRGGDLHDDLEAVSGKLLAELTFPDVDRSGMSTTFA